MSKKSKKVESGVTTNDIEKVQVYVITKDGRLFVGVADTITTTFIVSSTTFVELDTTHVTEMSIQDVIKRD